GDQGFKDRGRATAVCRPRTKYMNELGSNIGSFDGPAAKTAGATDEALMEQLSNGSHVAFEELVSRYESQVLTFCYAFMRNREAAEDIAQETFLRVFRNSKRYQPVAKFTTWLYKIAANLCINELKKGELRHTLSLDEPAGPDPEGSRIVQRIATGERSPRTQLERSEAQSLILKAIEHLPPDQRATLI